jgi:hypothetical protein
MGLEVTTYVDGLVSTNPVSGDPMGQSDDHIRLLKSALKNTFPNVTGAVTATQTQLNAVLTSGTEVASTSGTSIDFTGIPSWVKRVTVLFSGVSTNSTSPVIVQLGDSGGIETTGYLGAVSTAQDASAVVGANFTTGIGTTPALNAATVFHGAVTLDLVSSSTNTWVATVVGATSFGIAAFTGSFSKSTSATLDRVRITTVGGTASFDAGVVNILYE